MTTVRELARKALKQAKRDLNNDDGHSEPQYILDALAALGAVPEGMGPAYLQRMCELAADVIDRLLLEREAVAAYPSQEAMEAAVRLEIKNTLGLVTTKAIGELVDKVANSRVAAAEAKIAYFQREYQDVAGAHDVAAAVAAENEACAQVAGTDRDTYPGAARRIAAAIRARRKAPPSAGDSGDRLLSETEAEEALAEVFDMPADDLPHVETPEQAMRERAAQVAFNMGRKDIAERIVALPVAGTR